MSPSRADQTAKPVVGSEVSKPKPLGRRPQPCRSTRRAIDPSQCFADGVERDDVLFFACGVRSCQPSETGDIERQPLHAFGDRPAVIPASPGSPASNRRTQPADDQISDLGRPRHVRHRLHIPKVCRDRPTAGQPGNRAPSSSESSTARPLIEPCGERCPLLVASEPRIFNAGEGCLTKLPPLSAAGRIDREMLQLIRERRHEKVDEVGDSRTPNLRKRRGAQTLREPGEAIEPDRQRHVAHAQPSIEPQHNRLDFLPVGTEVTGQPRR